MADVLPDTSKTTLNDPFAELTGSLAGTSRLPLEVVESGLLTPHMQRLRLTAPQLAGFGYAPGQDVMLLVDVDGNRPVRRRYTIRALDTASQTLTLDIVLHGDGPGERWVRAARPGDKIEGIGPRGKITTAAGADWHLFAGDEAALPAIFAMAESLPAGLPVRVLLEIPGPEDELDLTTAGQHARHLAAPRRRPRRRAGRAGGGGWRGAVPGRPRPCVPAGRGSSRGPAPRGAGSTWVRAGPGLPEGLLGPRAGERQSRRAGQGRLIT